MSIEQELTEQLAATTAAGPQQARNIRIALYFYGFGEVGWPTLDETARAFGVGSRERVRQILAGELAALRMARLPSLRTVSRLIRSRSVWEARELGAAIAARTGDRPDLGLRALLGLMHELGLARHYQAYDHDLERLTRAQLSTGRGYVLARTDAIGSLHWALFGARRLSLRRGLVSTDCLVEMLGRDAPTESVKTLLRLDPSAWTSSEGDEFWWVLETADNALVALAAKAFAVIEDASPAHLAESLSNALRARTPRERVAGATEVRAWIEGSRWFARRGGRVVFMGRPEALNPAEQELADFLCRCGSAAFPAIKAHLNARGVTASKIGKAATQSPFVYIDRSRGPRAFRYRLVGGWRDQDRAATSLRAEAPSASPAGGTFH